MASHCPTCTEEARELFPSPKKKGHPLLYYAVLSPTQDGDDPRDIMAWYETKHLAKGDKPLGGKTTWTLMATLPSGPEALRVAKVIFLKHKRHVRIEIGFEGQ